MSQLEGKGLSFTFSKRPPLILKEIDFSIPSGKVTVFLGMSGSGKTTLLKCITGLTTLQAGSILYDGKEKAELTTKDRIHLIGYVAQNNELFPHMTVYQNCIHPQKKVLNRTKQEAKEVADPLLHHFNIAHLKNRYPAELSGGQKQRVAIARALGMGSKILLLDEPTSALDPESTEKLKAILTQLKAAGYTLVITTHDMAFARAVLDKVYFMEEGSVIESFHKDAILKESKTYRFLYHQSGEIA